MSYKKSLIWKNVKLLKKWAWHKPRKQLILALVKKTQKSFRYRTAARIQLTAASKKYSAKNSTKTDPKSQITTSSNKSMSKAARLPCQAIQNKAFNLE